MMRTGGSHLRRHVWFNRRRSQVPGLCSGTTSLITASLWSIYVQRNRSRSPRKVERCLSGRLDQITRTTGLTRWSDVVSPVRSWAFSHQESCHQLEFARSADGRARPSKCLTFKEGNMQEQSEVCVVDVVPAACKNCGSTERTGYNGNRSIESHGFRDGQKFNRITWKYTTCKRCGHRRCEQVYEMVLSETRTVDTPVKESSRVESGHGNARTTPGRSRSSRRKAKDRAQESH